MAKIEVKCTSCGKQFKIEDWETKACPRCGKVAKGPNAQ